MVMFVYRNPYFVTFTGERLLKVNNSYLVRRKPLLLSAENHISLLKATDVRFILSHMNVSDDIRQYFETILGLAKQKHDSLKFPKKFIRIMNKKMLQMLICNHVMV